MFSIREFGAINFLMHCHSVVSPWGHLPIFLLRNVWTCPQGLDLEERAEERGRIAPCPRDLIGLVAIKIDDIQILECTKGHILPRCDRFSVLLSDGAESQVYRFMYHER